MRFEKAFKAAGKQFSDYERGVPAPYMRGSFYLAAKPENAEITITAFGFYDLYINGVRITKGILAPYISNPEQVVVYDSYNIAPYLREGKNVVGLILGNGFTNNYGGRRAVSRVRGGNGHTHRRTVYPASEMQTVHYQKIHTHPRLF